MINTLKIELKCGIYELEKLKKLIKNFGQDFDYEMSNENVKSQLVLL